MYILFSSKYALFVLLDVKYGTILPSHIILFPWLLFICFFILIVRMFYTCNVKVCPIVT